VDESKEVSRSGVSETLRLIAKDLHDGSPQEQTVAQAIDSLADASDALREKDSNDAIQAIDMFARRNPIVFMGAAALAGFAATRLIKAVKSDEVCPRDVPLGDVLPSEDQI
jgi:hypothetical protein